MSKNAKYLVVIAGATGVGKTALSLRLAEHYKSVIVSADSRQFYREMNIGTAKPTQEQLDSVIHFFINNKSVSDLFGAGHFEKEAIPLIENLFEKLDIVFVVGGSGLYINALLNGVDDFEEIPASVRTNLISEYKIKGIEWLQESVKAFDPQFFETGDLHNPQRMVRALEVYTHTKKPFSEFLNKKKKERNFTAIKILVNLPREKLYGQINSRVNDMVKKGLLEEVKSLEKFRGFNALKTVGYNELFEFIDGNATLEHAIEKIKQHTRNYAKRQLTWFRNQDDFEEFEPEDFEKICAYINLITSHG